MSEKPDYPVGYKKPPNQTQFKPGQSGNPRGRPKKVLSIEEVAQQEARMSVGIVEDGKQKKIEKLRLLLRQHFTLAIKGDTRSAHLVLKYLPSLEPSTNEPLNEALAELRAANRRHATRPRPIIKLPPDEEQ
jgi:hypothetical protein